MNFDVGIGNTTRSAEFNFYCDPEAANIVLERSNCNIVILPWEACLKEKINIPMVRISEYILHLKCYNESFSDCIELAK